MTGRKRLRWTTPLTTLQQKTTSRTRAIAVTSSFRQPARRALVAAAFALLVMGCGDGGTEPDPTVSGTWDTRHNGTDFVFFFSQAEHAVTGYGRVGFTDVTVDGTYHHPTLSVSIRAQGEEPISLLGNRSGDRILAVLNGGGWQQEQIELTR